MVIGGGIGRKAAGASGSFLLRMVEKWKLLFLFFILLFSTFSAINQSIEQKNLVPLIITLGGRLFNADALLYHQATQPNPLLEIDDIEVKSQAFAQAEGFWQRVTSFWAAIKARVKMFVNVFAFYGSILVSLYTMFMMYFVIAWLISKANTSGELFTYTFAAIIMLLIGALYGSFVFQYDNNGREIPEDKFLMQYVQQINPIKGTIYTATHFRAIWGPLVGENVQSDMIPGEEAIPDNVTDPTILMINDTDGSVEAA